MPKPTTLSELLTAVGDDNLSYQNLVTAGKGFAHKKHDSEVTFYTSKENAEGCLLHHTRVGIVVWMDVDAYQAALEGR